jgi:uncharacterized protein (TIGR03435 family)
MTSEAVFLKNRLNVLLEVRPGLRVQTGGADINRQQYSLPHGFAHYYIEMRFFLNCALAVALAATAHAQTPAQVSGTALAFDVASVKPSQQITPAMIQSGKIHVGMKIDAARVDIGYWTVAQIICEAYKLKAYQVTGPDWLKSLQAQHFDVVATMPAGATKEQVPQMLQALLAERFKLEFHNDAKDANVYALVVAKGGLKIKESTPPPPPSEEEAAKAGSATGSSTVAIKQTGTGATMSTGTGETQKVSPSPDGKSMRIEISNVTISKLAEGIAPMVDLPIVDMTELKGRYDVTLDISMQEMMNIARKAGANVPAPAPSSAAGANPGDAVSDPDGGSIFQAVAGLGMKLEKRKVPLTGIFVDKVEKMPTEN